MDRFSDEYASTSVNCRVTNGEKYVEFTIEATSCFLEDTYHSYRVYYQVEAIKSESFVEIMYLYNMNKPSELTLDLIQNTLVSGDEFNFLVSFQDTELTYSIPSEESNQFIWSKRNSIVKFNNLILPCEGVKL